MLAVVWTRKGSSSARDWPSERWNFQTRHCSRETEQRKTKSWRWKSRKWLNMSKLTLIEWIRNEQLFRTCLDSPPELGSPLHCSSSCYTRNSKSIYVKKKTRWMDWTKPKPSLNEISMRWVHFLKYYISLLVQCEFLD